MIRRISALTYAVVCRGTAGEVRLAPDTYIGYMQAIDGTDEISVKRKTQLERYFQEFCDHVLFFKRLSDLKFKNEGNFRVGKSSQTTVTVWAFKAWKWRLYGAILSVEGRRTFVGVNIDPDKKQDKADRQMLTSTAQKISELSEFWA